MDKIYIVKTANLSNDEKYLLISIEGIINRRGPSVYADYDNAYKLIDTNQYDVTYIDDVFSFVKDNINEFKGYVLFDGNIKNGHINAACLIAGALDLLIVTKNIEDKIKAFGLEKKEDVYNYQGDYIDIQEAIFDKYQHLLNNEGIVHQVENDSDITFYLRDLSILNKWVSLYTGEDPKGKAFLEKVCKWAKMNAPIYGWTTDEISFVDTISKCGHYIVPADWAANQSFFTKKKSHECFQKKIESKGLANKHYLTIVVSDGDNIQWEQRSVGTDSYFEQAFAKKDKFVMGMTISPTLNEINPACMQYLYDKGQGIEYVSGVSGCGYINPNVYPEEALRDFCEKTSRLFKSSDLHLVTILDNLKNIKNMPRVLEEYSKYDNIEGGFIEFDPIYYGGGHGRMFFTKNGKPFVSVRETMWKPSDYMNRPGDRGWLDEMIIRINASTVDPTTEFGYTLLNVHPWSTTIEDLNYVIAHLSDDIQVVSPREFIRLVKENVKR